MEGAMLEKIDCYVDCNDEIRIRETDALVLCSSYVEDLFLSAEPGDDLTVTITDVLDKVTADADVSAKVTLSDPGEVVVEFLHAPAGWWVEDGAFEEVLYSGAMEILYPLAQDCGDVLFVSFTLEA